MGARVTGQPVSQPCGWKPENIRRPFFSQLTCWEQGLQPGPEQVQGSVWDKALFLQEEAIPVLTPVPLRSHHYGELQTSICTAKRRVRIRNEGILVIVFFFLIGGHTLDEGFIIKHWMPAASFLRALTYPGQDGVKCNPLLCILCVCMCQTNYSIVIFPLLVHFYTRFLTLVCPVWVYVGTWRCNLRGGMTFEHAVWQKKTPWLSMWTSLIFHSPLWCLTCVLWSQVMIDILHCVKIYAMLKCKCTNVK